MYDKDFIKQIKQTLTQEKKRLEEQLSVFADKNVHNLDDYKAKFPSFGGESDENAKEVATFEDRLNLERTLEKELHSVVNSLEKIEKGTYGVCKYCGEDIGEKRLIARPTSSACIPCKKRLKGEL